MNEAQPAGTCEVCAGRLSDSGRFCPSCGTPVTPSSMTPTGTAPRRGDGDPGPVARPTPGRTPGSRDATGVATGLAGPGQRFEPGQVLAERYRVVGLVGKGGMGEVYRADDLRLGQPVALKFLPERLIGDADRLGRFYNEVRVAREITHPAVCRVHDIGEFEGQPFLSMELVDGENLASLLRRIGRLPTDKALEIARQVCAGLAAAHDKGVLHRDLKPDNVMIDGRGKARITDFGLAGLAEGISGAEVRSGTPAYMAPEQLTGREVTVRSDLYALGLLLYELVTGRRAFEGRSLADLTRQHTSEAPLPPSQLVSDLDPALERVILRCLEKEPARRPSSALWVSATLPGGDPLADALAAGQTPSPEMVAAAGGEGLLARKVAVADLVVALGGIALAVWLSAPGQIINVQPFERTPQGLVDKSREILEELGYAEAPVDWERGYDSDADYLQHVATAEGGAGRWRDAGAGQPPVATLWYRDSPRPLVPAATRGQVEPDNPPLDVSGMRGVRVDMKGRLVEFYAVPPQLDDDAPPADGPDWDAVLEMAGLDAAALEPAESEWLPPFDVEERQAWSGRFPDSPDVPLRVEAASYRGRLAWFRVLGDWSRPERMRRFQHTPAQQWSNRIGLALFVLVQVAAALLARHHVRGGRGDRPGAWRLARATFLVYIVSWLMSTHWVVHPAMIGLTAEAIAHALLVGTIFGVLYLALEPFVRRWWPGALISWTRLLCACGPQDSLIGAHVLMGAAAGVVSGALFIFVGRLSEWLGQGGGSPNCYRLNMLLGPGDAAATMLWQFLDAIALGMVLFFLLVLLRAAVRREWLAAGLVVATLSSMMTLGSTDPPYLAFPLFAMAWAIPTIVVLRFGLLPLLSCVFFLTVLVNHPVSIRLDHWTARPTWLIVVMLAAIAVWAFRTAVAPSRAFAPARDGTAV